MLVSQMQGSIYSPLAFHHFVLVPHQQLFTSKKGMCTVYYVPPILLWCSLKESQKKGIRYNPLIFNNFASLPHEQKEICSLMPQWNVERKVWQERDDIQSLTYHSIVSVHHQWDKVYGLQRKLTGCSKFFFEISTLAFITPSMKGIMYNIRV